MDGDKPEVEHVGQATACRSPADQRERGWCAPWVTATGLELLYEVDMTQARRSLRGLYLCLFPLTGFRSVQGRRSNVRARWQTRALLVTAGAAARRSANYVGAASVPLFT